MKQTNKKLIELIHQLRNEHNRTDQTLLNITYFLIKNYKACDSLKNLDVSDLMIVYDNLEYNNELLNIDNIDEYDTETLYNIGLSNRQIKQIATGQKILLLNYYTIKGQLKNCKICLDPNYNIID